MASPQAAATTSILPVTDGTACQVSITSFSSFGFPRSFNKGVPVLGKTYTECAQLVASKRTQYHGFYFDETKSPSVCQPKRFDSLPGANLLMYTPGDAGMVDLGAFGGAAFVQPGYALGQALGASSKVCGETCRVNPSCAVAVFGGGECVLAGMKPTNLGASVSFFTGEKCGGDDGKAVWGVVMVGEEKGGKNGVAKSDVKVDSEIEKILEGVEGEPEKTEIPSPASTAEKGPEKNKDVNRVGDAEMRVAQEGAATEGFKVVPEVKGAQPSNQVVAEEKDEMIMDSASDTKKPDNASKNQAPLNGNDAPAWSVPKIAVVAGIAAALLGLFVAGVCIFVHRKTMKKSSDSNSRGDIESNAPKKRPFLRRPFTPKVPAATGAAGLAANKGRKRSTSMENLDAFRAAAAAAAASNNEGLFVRDASLPSRMNDSAVPEARPSVEYYSDETRLIDEDGFKRKKAARYPNLKIDTSRD
ncbi:hypothetical protein BJ741DRAFT_623875 [Chytriomyces cf. hyalinus JEL632]|nr:hypothetical protein BJ741DRAFT_623875 [Chytriomyces cf. hyalinus JEL632]